MTAPALVTLDVWRLPRRRLVAAAGRLPLVHRATHRRHRRDPAPEFVKVLGTADATFLPRGATPTRWAVLATWADPADAARWRRSSPLRWWDDAAVEHAALAMRPLRSRGRWDAATPFGRTAPTDDAAAWAGPVVAITRATLRPGRVLAFYRAVPGVVADLAAATGLRVAFGIGEAPLLRQGTVSVWDGAEDLQAFTATSPRHDAAVRATPTVGWYAEELFARFALVDGQGSVDGRSVAG